MYELAPLMGLYWLRAREGVMSGVGIVRGPYFVR